MSTAILNVFITNVGDPCTISNAGPVADHDWKLAVLHCDGRVLNWSEGRYRYRRDDPWVEIPLHRRPDFKGQPTGDEGWWYENVLTRDGHVELEVPPGCYVLVASLHNWIQDGVLYGNWVTDHAIVQACCDKDICSTIYAPSAWRCAQPLLDMVLPLLARHNLIQADVVGRAGEVLRQAFGNLHGGHFEQHEHEVLKRAFVQMGKGQPGGPQEKG